MEDQSISPIVSTTMHDANSSPLSNGPARRSRRVVIAGGGFAAVEALLALRSFLGERVQITLIAASDRFAFRPAATAEVFGAPDEQPRSYSLPEVAADAGAEFRRGRLEAVAPVQHSVRLDSGESIGYESLVLALGARARVAIPGALTYRDQRDVPAMRRLLAEALSGSVRQLVFAVPSGCAWSLPVYELALLSAAYLAKHRREVEISVVSPAAAPLEIFGPRASQAVRQLMIKRGVRFVAGSVPASVRRDGALQLHFGGAVPADRVVAVPQLRGPRVAGVPSRWWGFVPVDAEGRVEGLADVYAAGDMTDFPIKQGGLAAQQADVIARVIAAGEGAQVSIPPAVDPGRVLEAQLLGGELPLALRAELDADGELQPDAAAMVRPLRTARPIHEKVAGRHLRAYLAGLSQR